MSLTGKVAIVTASTKGIGLAIAKKYVQEGCNVVVSSRKQENVDKAIQELQPLAEVSKSQVIGITCDVLSIPALERLVTTTIEKFGKLNVLVAHTGGNENVYGQQLMELSDEEWDKAFDENVKSVWHLVKLAVPHLKKENGGSIICTSSVTAYTSPKYVGLFPIAKATLIAAVKSMAAALGSSGIRVNCITAGIIETAFSEKIRSNTAWSELILQHTGLGRFGKDTEIAGVALFLASDNSSYVSGESLVCAGAPGVNHF